MKRSALKRLTDKRLTPTPNLLHELGRSVSLFFRHSPQTPQVLDDPNLDVGVAIKFGNCVDQFGDRLLLTHPASPTPVRPTRSTPGDGEA